MSNDKTIKDVGMITSPRKAVELVKSFYVKSDGSLVSVLNLNRSQEVIGISHFNTDMNEHWRSAVTLNAAEESSCESVIVVYDKSGRDFFTEYDKMVDIFEDLRKKLRTVQVGLTDVIALGSNSFYSYADEIITRI